MDNINAYLAGFFDGEGFIGLFRQNVKTDGSGGNWYAQIHVSQIDRQPLELFKMQFGGKVYRHEWPDGRASHSWRLYRTASIENALRSMYPFLIVKKAEADIILNIVWNANSDAKLKQIRRDRKFI